MEDVREAPTRWARLTEGRRRRRKRVAAVMAAAGAAVIVVALAWSPASDPGPGASTSAGREAGAPDAVDGLTGAGIDPGKPATTGPGGVGPAPEKTGLPAAPAEGGRLRTGTVDDGCFTDMRSYLDEWHRTGQEPEPCFTSQPPSGQRQPEGVRRTYNGERF